MKPSKKERGSVRSNSCQRPYHRAVVSFILTNKAPFGEKTLAREDLAQCQFQMLIRSCLMKSLKKEAKTLSPISKLFLNMTLELQTRMLF